MSLIRRVARQFFASDSTEIGDIYMDEAGVTWLVLANGTTVQLGAGGGSQPGTLVGISNSVGFAQADAFPNLPCDGAGHTVDLIMATPPSWLDGAGNIIAPGLYALGCIVSAGAAPTTPGLYGQVDNQVFTEVPFPLDALPLGGIRTQEVATLLVADLPLGASVFVVLPTDATATVGFRPYVYRLASAS